ncbi:MAG: co-chaperone GroES [Candidatus Campbellbacteria bacterium]|nr:co-chaperone GroES [Candidatus Campbellbacteria bacterium]
MDKNKVIPLYDRVLIKKRELNEVSKAGIILPEMAKGDSTNIGEIIAVGEGRKDEKGNLQKISVKEGQTVVFSWGDKIELDREEYFIVNENNILAIINN